MRIGFDIHGVLDTHPDVFKPMIKMLVMAGHDVCVITGPPETQAKRELGKLRYTFGIGSIFSVVDFLIEDGVDFTYDDNGNPWCDEQKWWDAKARICKKHGIHILIDDSLKYKPAFDLIDSKFVHIKEII